MKIGLYVKNMFHTNTYTNETHSRLYVWNFKTEFRSRSMIPNQKRLRKIGL
jgi:hypothetical protein